MSKKLDVVSMWYLLSENKSGVNCSKNACTLVEGHWERALLKKGTLDSQL